MADMRPNKVPMPQQAPDTRNKNFDEVATGYLEQDAITEASRCLGCKNKPCVAGCPVNVDIPEFIAQIKNGDFARAYEIITRTNSLPAICGRVCPQENQCEKLCVRKVKHEAVAIGRLERFAADFALFSGYEGENIKIEKNGRKAAVIGAGPAGLTCAGDLARAGFDVTVYEAFHKAGGVLVYGIPEFRLPKSVVAKEIEKLEKLGVKIVTNHIIGKSYSIDELLETEGFDAVFIGSGAGLPQFMDIEGENLSGVYSANEFLTRVNLMHAYDERYDTPVRRAKSVAVIGGGNVAMDAARCAKRLGSEKVYIIYRRGEDEIPARLEEIHHAREEGIEFILLCAPVRIIGDENGTVCAIECINMRLGQPDENGRRSPVPIEGSEHIIETDAVITAIGTTPNPLIRMTTPGLVTNSRGCITADEKTGLTSRERVYAGGDAVTGAATVILAMGAGKQAASAIIESFK